MGRGGRDTLDQQSDAAIWTSPDGHQWARDQTAPDLGGPSNDAIYGLTTDGKLDIAVGATQLDGNVDAEAWTSPDGRHWTRASAEQPVLGGAMEQTMNAATVSANDVIAVGFDGSSGNDNPQVWTSTGSREWTRVTNDTVFDESRKTKMVSVATDGTTIVAVGTMDDGHGQVAASWYRMDSTT